MKKKIIIGVVVLIVIAVGVVIYLKKRVNKWQKLFLSKEWRHPDGTSVDKSLISISDDGILTIPSSETVAGGRFIDANTIEWSYKGSDRKTYYNSAA